MFTAWHFAAQTNFYHFRNLDKGYRIGTVQVRELAQGSSIGTPSQNISGGITSSSSLAR